MKRSMTLGVNAALMAAVFMAAGCRVQPDEPEPEPAATQSESPRSIFQDPDAMDEVEIPPETLPPLETTLAFPDGTAELTEAVRAELATVLESPQVAAGGMIILRGHSDSSGTGEEAMADSRDRAEAVRDFLVENDLDEDRITVIAFGEQNPIRPNALPDGSPNEEGRAINRRVELVVTTENSGEREQTLIESLSTPEPTGTAARNAPATTRGNRSTPQ